MTRPLILLATLMAAGCLTAQAQVGTGNNGGVPGFGNEPFVVGPGTAESDEDSGILFGDRPGGLLLTVPKTEAQYPVPLPWSPVSDPRQKPVDLGRRN
jgi:hypothetical protein